MLARSTLRSTSSTVAKPLSCSIWTTQAITFKTPSVIRQKQTTFPLLKQSKASVRSYSMPPKNDDVTKWSSSDGHFRRQVSSFRDEIKKGGKFEPELSEPTRESLQELESSADLRIVCEISQTDTS
jgi:hypothetical protein